jgi:hypothetical protein
LAPGESRPLTAREHERVRDLITLQR